MIPVNKSPYVFRTTATHGFVQRKQSKKVFFRPEWADTTFAGAVRPRNYFRVTKRPGGLTHADRRKYVGPPGLEAHYNLIPVAHATGSGCANPPGLNRNTTQKLLPAANLKSLDS